MPTFKVIPQVEINIDTLYIHVKGTYEMTVELIDPPILLKKNKVFYLSLPKAERVTAIGTLSDSSVRYALGFLKVD